ncbi:MAG: DEAD/DEAH box helicase family protein [Gammaproteobacteria bacterium]
MNEAETRAELIDPALKAAGWGVAPGSRIAREVITLGRLHGAGRRAKQDIADYVLIHKNRKLAVIEAKRASAAVSEGLAQAKRYAEKLQTPFAYSTNGRGIYRVNMRNGKEGEIGRYPAPQELWAAAFGASEAREKHWREEFAKVPFETRGGQWTPRYYQHNAISKALDAIAAGRARILLTMATGTGKTAIAFQIAWKLYTSKWNLSARNAAPEGGQAPRRPRILFLADRNILADQAFNEFSAFPDGAMVRIAPDVIRKKGRVPTNGNVFFTIFQTFMSGRAAGNGSKPSFGGYSPDFFDFIVIDECHRGGANEESRWRAIMEHFAPAVQLGLTATPRRNYNIDTYEYFGEPVYVYSLKEGINDGYLTPFKVKQIASTIDAYVHTDEDEVMEGEVEIGKRYTEDEFNRVIEIREREEGRVKNFMAQIKQAEKTLVFCATQHHALIVRDLINQVKTSGDPDYCVRVTSDEGKAGDQYLRAFRDNERTIPAILTTSRKLSTGVDARNVRNIVLMRPVKSMIEFKQIIGRGTRLFEGKDYFTVYDFARAYEHFNDPEWDGEPIAPEPCERCGNTPCTCVINPPEPCAQCGAIPCICKARPPALCAVCGQAPCNCDARAMLKIKLADGKARSIRHMMVTTFYAPDGRQISAKQFVEQFHGDLPRLFEDEEELRRMWSRPDTRQHLLQDLAESGYGGEQLANLARLVNGENSDLYDVLAYIAFALTPLSRRERVEARRETIRTKYDDYKQREFLDFVLKHYIAEGVGELAEDKLTQLLQLRYGSATDAKRNLGEMETIRDVFIGFQRHLYAPAAGERSH